MNRIIDAVHISEREKYLTKFSSYPLKDLTGIINSYKAQLSKHPSVYQDMLRYFKELNFRTGCTLYEQNKEVYSNLLKSFNGNLIKTEAFHDAFFAFNCIEFGKLISDYFNNKIKQQNQTIVKNLINELKTHPTFFKRCENLFENKQFGKYYVVGIKRLLKLIKITKNSQHYNPIDDYLSQFSIYINYNSQISMGDFLRKIDVAIFMPQCVENNLTVSFDEIYEVYDQWRSQEELLLYNIKEGKKLSKYNLSDKRPYTKLPVGEIRISIKDIKKSKRKNSMD